MEAQVIRTYLEWIAELPWNKRSDDQLDLAHAATVLDEDHYGLKDVKDRILEFLAVRHLRAEQLASEVETTGEQPMSPFLAFIRLLSDPTIAFLLLSTGSVGLLAELWSPNFVTGILGGIAIILAFIGLGALPLNVGGLLLVILAFVLFGLELTVTSHGLLGVGGVICLALGASALFTGPVDPFGPAVRVALPVIITSTATAAILMALVVYGALRSRGMAAPIGMAGTAAAVPPGSLGVVRRPLEPIGSVYAGGEEWSARSADSRPIQRDTPVRIVARDGLTLVVEPDPSSSATSS